MIDAYKKMWTNYAVFSGRASRSDFWYAFLFNWLILIALSIFSYVFSELGLIFQLIYNLARLIPWMALCFRRLHDTGKSGWFLLLEFIPVVGWIILLVLYAGEGEMGANQYGMNPNDINNYYGQPYGGQSPYGNQNPYGYQPPFYDNTGQPNNQQYYNNAPPQNNMQPPTGYSQPVQPPVQNKFCKGCGIPISENVRFCANCGTQNG